MNAGQKQESAQILKTRVRIFILALQTFHRTDSQFAIRTYVNSRRIASCQLFWKNSASFSVTLRSISV